MSDTQDILTVLGIAGGTALASGGTSDAIDSATNSQLDSNTAAALLYKEGADTQAAAILEAAGISAGAAKEAAGIAKDYYDQAIAQQEKALGYQKEMYSEAKSYQEPFYQSGQWALTELKDMMQNWDGSVEAYEKSPYYDWIQEETLKGLDQSASAKGKLQSGAQQDAVMQYSKDLASTDYDNYLTRYYQSLSPYQYMAGMGQSSANALSSAATSNANNATNIYGNMSNLLGSSGQTQANYTNQAGSAQAAGVADAGAVHGNMYNTLAGLERERGDISAYGDIQQANNTSNTLGNIGGMIGYVAEPVMNAVSGWFGGGDSSSPNIGGITPDDAYTQSSKNFLADLYT